MENPVRPHVLVIDSDPAVRALIVALLRRQGYDTDATSDADEAVALGRSLHPAAVVVEPRTLGGARFLDALHSNGDGKANLIVVTTPDGHDLPYRDQSGVRAVLLKPFRIDELSDAVAECCDGDGSAAS